jgi:hypothetical protein
MRIFQRLLHENWYFSCLRCSHSEVHPKKRKKSIINLKWRTIPPLYSCLTECLHPAPPLYRIRVGFYPQLDANEEVINPNSIYDVIRFWVKVDKPIYFFKEQKKYPAEISAGLENGVSTDSNT